jgi:hypothetical protein
VMQSLAFLSRGFWLAGFLFPAISMIGASSLLEKNVKCQFLSLSIH